MRNTPADYKTKYKFLCEVDSQALANTQIDLERAYTNFFKTLSKFPKWKTKNSKNPVKTYRTCCVNNNIRIDGSSIKLPKLGWVDFKKTRDVPDNYILKNVTVKQKSKGFEIIILFEFEVDAIRTCTHGMRFHERKTPPKTLGLDYSASQLFIDSEGRSAEYPKFFRKSQDKLAKAQQKLSRMKGLEKGVPPSNNWIKQKQKVAKIHEHIKNQRHDFLHKLSRKIANSYDVVCVESLNLKVIAQYLRLGKSTYDNGYGRFLHMLKYKLFEQPFKRLIKVDMYFPSTKLCSNCGCKKHMLLSDRIYVCPNCELIIDRDVNSAINLKQEGLIKLNKERKILGILC